MSLVNPALDPFSLADPTQRADCGHESGDHLCISVDSWWADLNYYLSAIPFLAVVDSGIMGISSDNVTFLPPSKDQMNFCYNVSSCYSSFPDTMKKWNKFYQQVKSYSSNFDDLLKYLWIAHVSSLKVACKKLSIRLQHYSKQEAELESSRALFVDYLAPPLFPSALIRTYGLQKGLPTQMLVSGNRAPFISDFTGFQNTVLLGLNFLHKVYKYTAETLISNYLCDQLNPQLMIVLVLRPERLQYVGYRKQETGNSGPCKFLTQRAEGRHIPTIPLETKEPF
ncbi:PREDICTED: UPF0762 protein C6orf58-like [Lipotes vexillifer]|uniref:UPF0762 protein C6orf58-like n=1 Tax=Lipotes vexillifer TaxID=118797 RepID=A0A340WM02_LIPVE|nr:PREDICTED: UPF0762 protein C6orf58-like [Lipotes vexillifer]